MRKFYQTEWQNIPFASIARTSSLNLADSEFYEAFYAEFFRRYNSWNDLPNTWRAEKERCAASLLSQLTPAAAPSPRILSVGCGLGYMEYWISSRSPHCQLYIHEVAPTAWKWISPVFPQNRTLTGLIPECIPSGSRFDLIYLSAVDYSMNADDLVRLLSHVRSFLDTDPARRGRCVLISASLETPPRGLLALLRRELSVLKTALRNHSDRTLGRPEQQFWGWMRSPSEYRSIMVRAGFGEILEGRTHDSTTSQYWISGQ